MAADRNRFTGGGVTAGLDFGLALLAELRGETAAQMAQLILEYDPQPPFEAGTPEAAGPQLTAFANDLMGAAQVESVEIAKASRQQRAQVRS